MRIDRLVVHQDGLSDASMLNPMAFEAMVLVIIQATAAGREVAVEIGQGMPRKVLRSVSEVVSWLQQGRI